MSFLIEDDEFFEKYNETEIKSTMVLRKNLIMNRYTITNT